jgi:hypothetical protein
MASENRNLRGKIHELEQLVQDLRSKVTEAEETSKDKDKQLASLSMYRYKIVHGLIEQECKVCLKRAKDEADRKHTAEILCKL